MTTTARPIRKQALPIAAKILAQKLIDWLGEDADGLSIEEAQEHIMDALSWGDTDGYRLAYRLQERYYYEPDEQLVDELSCASHEIYKAHKDLIIQWVKDNAIAAVFKAGDRIAFDRRVSYGKTERVEGTIKEVRGETAEYTLDYGAGNSWHIVPFEEAQKL